MKSSHRTTKETKPDHARFEKTQKIAVSLSTDIERALAAHEMFARASFHKDIAPKFNNTYQAWGYNVIQTALVSELIMTLTRMHDADDRSASIPQIVKLLGDPAVTAALKANARAWMMDRPSHSLGPAPYEIQEARESRKRLRAEETAAEMERLARNACRRALRFETDSMRSALHKFRNKHLAHSALNPPTLDLKYSNLSTVLKKTASIVDDLRLAVTGHQIDSLEERKEWRTKAGHFWRHSILPFDAKPVRNRRLR